MGPNKHASTSELALTLCDIGTRRHHGSSAVEPLNQPLAVGIENDCQHNDQADYDRLEIVADTSQLKACAQDLQDTGARQGADARTLPTVEASAAYNDCSNSVKFVPSAGYRATDVEPQQIDDRGHAGRQAADHERGE